MDFWTVSTSTDDAGLLQNHPRPQRDCYMRCSRVLCLDVVRERQDERSDIMTSASHLLHEELPDSQLCRLQRRFSGERWHVQRLTCLTACLIWLRCQWRWRFQDRHRQRHDMLHGPANVLRVPHVRLSYTLQFILQLLVCIQFLCHSLLVNASLLTRLMRTFYHVHRIQGWCNLSVLTPCM